MSPAAALASDVFLDLRQARGRALAAQGFLLLFLTYGAGATDRQRLAHVSRLAGDACRSSGGHLRRPRSHHRRRRVARDDRLQGIRSRDQAVSDWWMTGAVYLGIVALAARRWSGIPGSTFLAGTVSSWPCLCTSSVSSSSFRSREIGRRVNSRTRRSRSWLCLSRLDVQPRRLPRELAARLR